MEDVIQHPSINNHSSDDTMPSLTKWQIVLLILASMPLLIPFFLAIQLTFFMLPIAGLGCLFIPKARIHGIFILASFGYWFALIPGAPHAWESLKLWKIIGGIGLFLLPYIPQSIPDLILILTYFWSMVLVPIVLMETVYWLSRKRCWKSLVTTLAILTVISAGALSYSNQCVDNFNKAEAFLGQTLPAKELFEKCGNPVYQELYRGPVGKQPHWVYTNGDFVVPVVIDENGIAEVHDSKYIFFD